MSDELANSYDPAEFEQLLETYANVEHITVEEAVRVANRKGAGYLESKIEVACA